MSTTCSRYLSDCSGELSYLIWRADIHRFSRQQLEQQWHALIAQLEAHCPHHPSACQPLNALIQRWEQKFRYLALRAETQQLAYPLSPERLRRDAP